MTLTPEERKDAARRGAEKALQRIKAALTIRFTAEWITRQSADDAADCDYEGAVFDTREEAQAAAIANGKAADCTEWWAVTEEKYSRRLGWEPVNRWVGDWEGNIEHVRGEHC